MATKKKTTKKTSSKKKNAKKTTKRPAKRSMKKGAQKKRRSSKKIGLIYADDDRCFWVTNGVVISNLIDLGDELSHMAEKVFKYHVNKERNDFADWVEKVLGDRTLAKELRRSRKPSTARTVVMRRLKFYDC